MAEDKVLQRAQRKAVEEAGIYLESTFHDYEAVRNGKSTQVSSLARIIHERWSEG
jgi:ketosteroid isomerase-like protein